MGKTALRVTSHVLAMGKGRLRAVQLTDLHLDDRADLGWLAALCAHVNALEPDVIFCTGDFTCKKNAYKNAQAALCILQTLRAQAGKFAVRGNHDVFGAAGRGAALIEGAGFTLLNNAVAETRTRDGRRLLVGGLDSAQHGLADLRAVSPLRAQAGALRILLLHEPRAAGCVRPGTADLILAGHTHAGQFHVPLLERFWMPKLSGRYIHGMYRVHGMPLYVSAGLGESGPRVRFRSPRELAVFHFI